jgi:hypothetical protein
LLREKLEGATVDAFHDDVEQVLFFGDFVDLDDVGVLESGGKAGFAQHDLFGEFGIFVLWIVKIDALDDDVAGKVIGAVFFGCPNLGLTALSKWFLQAITALSQQDPLF